MSKELKCRECGKSVGYCVSTGCRPKQQCTAKVDIMAREWLGFEDV